MDVSLDKDKIRQILEKERTNLLEQHLESVTDGGSGLPINPDHGDLARIYDSRQRRIYLDSLAQEKLDQMGLYFGMNPAK